MNKQELIDKAIIRFKGKWASADWKESKENKHCLIVLKKPLNDLDEEDIEANEDNFTGALRCGGTGFNPEFCEFVCLKSEYFQRALELGWINGYKWGVEYPTNGNKPDLPGDAVVCATSHTGTYLGNQKVGSSSRHLDIIESFSIVDERYKPKQPEVSSETNTTEFGKKEFLQDFSVIANAVKSPPDNSWHERGELPPVGVECVIFPRCSKARITYMGNGVACYVDLSNGLEYSCATSSFEFSPMKSEREKFVEAAFEVLVSKGFAPQSEDADYFYALYDAGFRA